MIRLLILADDLTGALDSGVQLAKTGAVTHVLMNWNIYFDVQEPETEIVVVDTETRHLPADQARVIIRDISARAMEAGVPFLYKKTDSVLRGNIGAELEGALEGSGSRELYFVPAFPRLGRITCGGIHYFNGIPIHETVFGKDPFEPVRDSYIPDIIRHQSEIPVMLVRQMEEIPDSGNEKSIILFDASNDDALSAIAADIRRKQPTNIFAGCAGFASYLPLILDLQQKACPVSAKASGVLVISGSLNPITARQLKTAEKAGFDCVTLTTEQTLYGIPVNEEGDVFLNEIIKLYDMHCRLLITSISSERIENIACNSIGDESRTVSDNLGRLVKRLFDRRFCGAVVVTGGDTLRGVLSSLGCTDIMPLCEIETGVVLSQANIAGDKQIIVSKSGGIGSDEVFVRIADFLDN
jgi:Uncharacterized protein conserved in bacteria